MRKTVARIQIAGEVVKTLDLEPVPLSADRDGIGFRIEVLKESRPSARYRVKILSQDFYRLKPTFPQVNGKPQHHLADELVFVEANDYIPKIETLRSRTVRGIIDKALRLIAEQFGPQT